MGGKAHRGELSINTELMLASDMVCARRMGLVLCKTDDHRLKIDPHGRQNKDLQKPVDFLTGV